MKKFISFFQIIIILLALIFSLSASSIKAYSPIVAVCSNGVLDDNALLTGLHSVEQLFEIRLDHYYLDGVAVRVKAVDEPSEATISVTDRGDGVIASATKTIEMTESWVYIDLTNVAMPRGVYLLKVDSNVNSPIAWKYSPNGACIEDSHVIYDGNVNLDKDLGFSVYAYPTNTNSQNSQQQVEPADPPSEDNSSNPDQSTSSSEPSQSSADNSTDSPPANRSNSSSTSSNARENNATSQTSNSNTPSTTSTSAAQKNNLAKTSKKYSNKGDIILSYVFIGLILGSIIFFIVWTARINRKKKVLEKHETA